MVIIEFKKYNLTQTLHRFKALSLYELSSFFFLPFLKFKVNLPLNHWLANYDP